MRSFQSLMGAALLGALIAGCGSSPTSVALPPLSAVTIGVHADTVAVDGSVQFTATAYNLSSQPVPNAGFVWQSSDNGVFTASLTGRITAKSEGQAWLFAEAGGLRDSASIFVVPGTAGWFAETSNSSAQLNGVFFQSDGRHGCVVGNAGEILTTSDAGATWVRRVSNTAFNLNSVWFPNASIGWVVGANGTVLHSADGGASWAPVASGSSDVLMGVHFAFPDTGVAVGSNGVVLASVPDSTPPFARQNPTTFVLNGVSFAGTRDGWAVGNNGTILGTEDRGLSWTVVPSITTQSLRGVWRVDRNFAVAVGVAGTVAHTIPGALSTDPPTWLLGSVGASFNLQGVMFLDANRGWTVGNNGSGVILATPDGGTTWNPQVAASAGTLRGVYFVDGLRGWAVGDYGRILHTATGGE